MKKIVILMLMAICMLSNIAFANSIEAKGCAPTSIANPMQAKMLARRAAIVDAFRQLNGRISNILSESYDGKWYIIVAE